MHFTKASRMKKGARASVDPCAQKGHPQVEAPLTRQSDADYEGIDAYFD